MDRIQVKKKPRMLDRNIGVVGVIAIAVYTACLIIGSCKGNSLSQLLPWIFIISGPFFLLLIPVYLRKKQFVKTHKRAFLEMDLEACIEAAAGIRHEIEKMEGTDVAHRELDDLDETSVEGLAGILHEAGREAVEKRKLVGKDSKITKFLEWDEIDEDAKDGRRIQARYLLSRFNIARK